MLPVGHSQDLRPSPDSRGGLDRDDFLRDRVRPHVVAFYSPSGGHARLILRQPVASSRHSLRVSGPSFLSL